MSNDTIIAREAEIKNIFDISKKVGIDDKYVIPYGYNKAKIDLSIFDELKDKKDGKLILVTAISPTKAGEGKTTTTIGLADALNKLNKKTIVALREPSMGPVFGLKGGACGGGYAQVNPMEDINLHFTGDMHAITSCNNLICACLDNHIYQGNELNIDLNNIVIKRCMDMNDRTLRSITIAQDKKSNGIERKDGFIISVASEVMACLCLATDFNDLEKRLNNILIAYTKDGKEVLVKDLNIIGSLMAIMKDAIKPNLVQTLENNPAFIHGGPFANIAHGTNSLISTKLALKLSEYVVTEAGFGSDLGGEKYFDLTSRIGDLNPSCVVIVCTIRAIKEHSDDDDIVQGFKNNLLKHINIIKNFNKEIVVAINRFDDDKKEELDLLIELCKKENIDVSISEVFSKGSIGGIDLANKVIEKCSKNKEEIQYIYKLTDTLEEKIYKIATKCYGAKGVVYEKGVTEKLNKYNNMNLPICMAKTPLTLADDLNKDINNFKINVDDIILANGAGFIIVKCGGVLLMPGLGKSPNAEKIFINNEGKIEGLF